MLYPEIQHISDGEEGDVIRIYVAARNESTDSQLSSEIEFRVDDESYDEDPDHIDAGDYDLVPPGETRFAGIIEWYTQEGDAGTHDITVRTTSQGNEVTEEITLGDATTFEVEIEDVRGIELYDTGQQRVEVDWLVENNTGSGGTTDITLTVDGTQEDIESGVQFADSQERTGTLEWDAEGASIGEHDIEVTTTDDSSGQTFVLEEEDIVEFDVVITGTEEVPAGTDSEIEYTVTNRTGEGSASRDVWLVVNGTEMDRHEDVGLDFDEQTTDTLIWPTTNNDVGETDVTVNVGFSGIDENIEGQATDQVTVLDPLSDPQFVTDGYITMSPRDVQGSTTWDSEDSWNEYDERQNVVVSGGVARLAAPPAPAFFRVTSLDATTVEAGEDAVIEYIVRNTGDETDTTDIWLEIDGEEVDRDEDIELGENGYEDADLTWQTEPSDGGEYEAVVHTEDDSDSVFVEVESVEDDPTNAVARWEFEDTEDTSTAVDSAGNYDMALSGPSYTSSAAVGSSALEFNGSSDTGEVDADVHDSREPFTVCGWVNTDTADVRQTLVTNRYVGTGGEFQFVITDQNELSVLRIDGSHYESSLSVTTNTYHFVAIAYDGSGEMLFKLDGSTETNSGDPLGQNRGWAFGYSPAQSAGYFSGILDDWHVFDAQLTDDQLEDIRSRGTS